LYFSSMDSKKEKSNYQIKKRTLKRGGGGLKGKFVAYFALGKRGKEIG